MSKNRRCRLVLLWHMHQPTYRSPVSGEYLLPWVLLHAMRDYYDMPALAAGYDSVRPVFNLVPGLLAQVEEYASQKARDLFLSVALKEARDLSEQEKAFLLDNFFVLNSETMVRPYPRFAQLADMARVYKRESSAAARFSESDLRDLQVWYFLTWTGNRMRTDPRVAELLRKGRDFTEGDKWQLRDAALDLLAGIVPLYGTLLADKRIEVSCSPMYHPILPLLVNSHSAYEAAPQMRLPPGLFAFPEDAVRHVSMGLKYVSDKLGQQITGMWPSEGSVSDGAMGVLNNCGVKWIATDEKMLFGSIGNSNRSREDALYTPWKFGDTAIFFRDAVLSDLMGFVYARWKPEAAVEHFISSVAQAASRSTLKSPVITIAMDGENAWEYYIHGGMNFLARLYQALDKDDRFEVVSPADVLAGQDQCPGIGHLRAGSWIDGTFSTWIGDPVKNKGWEHLTSARHAVASHLARNHLEEQERNEITDLVMRAEASDWFWWFGKGHTSKYDVEFDLLFRQHLKALYMKMGLHPPHELDQPLDPPEAATASMEVPVYLISPSLTGKLGSYYKWLSAGRAVVAEGFYHRPRHVLVEMMFGYDLDKLYLRLRGIAPMRALMQEQGMSLVLNVTSPLDLDLRFLVDEAGNLVVTSESDGFDVSGVEAALQTVLEFSVPLLSLGIDGTSGRPAAVMEFYAVVETRGRETERFPHTENISLAYRGEQLDVENWHV